MTETMSLWGSLQERYETKRPRKLLALDGGGIRGVITLEILAKIESELKQKTGSGDNFRLCDYFDYIAGTSTGAIIAAGLSIGMSVKELLDFYIHKGKDMFDKNFILYRWKALYESGPLLTMLKETFGSDTDLIISKGKFKCLLLVVTMNRSTDSPWPVSNNPFAKYNNLSRADCNAKIRLYQLVRASTAAPVYFPPETIQWDADDPNKTFVFVDGGVTPYNNPAFLLYRMATQPCYRLNWETGEEKMLIVSVGTGSAPSEGEYRNLLDTATGIPNNLMYAMQVDQDVNCRTIGRCTFGDEIDRETGTMISDQPQSVDTGRDFLYIRYNVSLTRKGLDDLGLYNIDPEDVRKMDSVKYIDKLGIVGQASARQVSLTHFGPFI
jgi:uncharacterized protein